MTINFVGFLAFGIGLLVGSGITGVILKKYYDERTQNDVNSIKEYYKEKYSFAGYSEPQDRELYLIDGSSIHPGIPHHVQRFDNSSIDPECLKTWEPVKPTKETPIETDIPGVTMTICEYGNPRADQSKNITPEFEGADPYVISPSQFGEFEDYGTISLTLYSDDVLVDEDFEIVQDIPNTIGVDSLTHFGEYEEDSVYVRNEKRKCDYEILLDEMTYEEFLKSKPYLNRAPFVE